MKWLFHPSVYTFIICLRIYVSIFCMLSWDSLLIGHVHTPYSIVKTDITHDESRSAGIKILWLANTTIQCVPCYYDTFVNFLLIFLIFGKIWLYLVVDLLYYLTNHRINAKPLFFIVCDHFHVEVIVLFINFINNY